MSSNNHTNKAWLTATMVDGKVVRRATRLVTAYSLSLVLLIIVIVASYLVLREEMAMQRTLTEASTHINILHRTNNTTVGIVMDFREAILSTPQNPRLVQIIERRLNQVIEELDTRAQLLHTTIARLNGTAHWDQFNWINSIIAKRPDALLSRYIRQMRGLNLKGDDDQPQNIRPLIPIEAAGAQHGALSTNFEKAAEQIAEAIKTHSNRVEAVHQRLTLLILGMFLLLSLLVVLPLWQRLIREHKHHEYAHKKLHYLAHTDQETGLPNLDGFELHIFPKWIPSQTQHNHYLLLIRIRNLDDIYNLIGNEQILSLHQSICERLTTSHIGELNWARSSESEYTTIISPKMVAEANTWIEPFFNNLSRPVTVAGILIHPHIGIAASQLKKPQTEGSSLLHEHQTNARMALRLFDHKTPELPVYDTQLTEELSRQNALINAISQGIKNREFVPFYQIKVDAKTGRPSSTEVLSRWLRRNGHIVGPHQFIPAAEKSGHLVAITYQLLERVVSDMQKLSSQGLSTGPVAINVNADVLQHKHFIDQALKAQRALLAVNSDLQIEITENVAINNMTQETRHVLQQLGENGIQIAIDDFGTGYASLQTLIDLPFDVLKIDRSFVTPMSETGTGSEVIAAIISLNAKLGKRSVIEGVEYEWQWHQLTKMGADELQGFYFQKPASLNDLSDWLKRDQNCYAAS